VAWFEVRLVLLVSLVGWWVDGLFEKQNHFVFVAGGERCALGIGTVFYYDISHAWHREEKRRIAAFE
jgi:hypothetical protein